MLIEFGVSVDVNVMVVSQGTITVSSKTGAGSSG